MNVKLRQKKIEKDFFKLINNAVSGKTMENVKKHRNIKVATTEIRRNFKYQSQIIILQSFHKKFISNRYEKTQILMNKPVYLGLFLLDLSKTVL